MNLEAKDLKALSPEMTRWCTSDSLYVFSQHMCFTGPEFLLMGSLRVQVDGAKRVAMASYMDIREAVTDSGVEPTGLSYESVFDFFKRTHNVSFIQQLRDNGTIHWVVATGGDVLFTPACFLVQESTHQALRGWGLRRPLLVAGPLSVDQFGVVAEDLQKSGKGCVHIKEFAKICELKFAELAENAVENPANEQHEDVPIPPPEAPGQHATAAAAAAAEQPPDGPEQQADPDSDVVVQVT